MHRMLSARETGTEVQGRDTIGDRGASRRGLSAYFAAHEHPGGIIICEERKFIYMKPAKTAGTSILREHLEKQMPGIIHQKNHPEQFADWIRRINDEELEKYFIFSVVRNPWDRLVSVAAYVKVSFKDFVRNINEHWKTEKIRVHSLPLHLYTHCNGIRFADMICRFETLQPDMNLVFDRIGMDRRPLPFVNRSRHGHYSAYYGELEIRVVEEIYAKDIEYFGYAFEKESSRRGSALGRLQNTFRRYMTSTSKRSG